ncbi:13013_t:CDS:2 [Dentiscutata erythropus]|uniref:13013_t:CDS:1 n=1 Tax=Dentiscutata erythropus TaxID=1348616 RepID=A0A9N9AF91_9GLOM|nr:13013_t:CDS:2 [Dentiscutata erythropus]
MYSSETIEPRSVRSVIGSTNGRSSQRRTGSVNASASSRLFMNAVKDANRSSRTTGEKLEENGTDRTTKRSYSPGKDQFNDDPKVKARKVEMESSIDNYRVHETDHSHDKISRIKLERQSGDQGSYNVLQEEHDHSRYVNERRPSQQSTRQVQQPRSVLDRLGKKGGLMTAYINPAFIQNSNANPIPTQSNSNITLTSKISRCRHWPNCDLGVQCKFHHPTEICPMVPNCPNSPRTCLYIHPANQDFNAYEQGGLYRQNSFGNGTGGQAAFGFGPIGQDPMNHFVVGQSAGGFSGMGQGVFVPNSFSQNNIQHSFGTNLHASNNKITSVQGSNIQGQRDIEQKSKSGAGSVTVNASTSITTTSRNVTTGTSSAQDANIASLPQSSQALAVVCKYGEHCANPNCMYAHSSPAAVGTGTIPSPILDVSCKYGTELATQEPCRFYPNCQNPVCPYLHVDNSGDVVKVPTPCRNGAHCTRPNCHFMHPWDMETDNTNIPCKFGYNCRRPDCAYSHPNGKKDHTPNIISERTFVSVPDEMTEKIIPSKDNNNNEETLQVDKDIVESVTRSEDSNNNNEVDNEATKNKEMEETLLRMFEGA